MSTELDIKALEQDIQNNGRRKLALFGLFLTGLLCFALLVHFSPHLQDQERNDLFRFPRGPEDLRLIHKVISRYTKDHFYYVLIGFCYLYIFLQSFAIPGPVFLSILSGAIFGGVPGFTLVCICATTGACGCYFLSYTLGRGLVLKFFPKLLIKFNTRVNNVNNQRSNLLWYMLFLRFTPLVPNWFVNLASPIVGMPLKYFAFGTFFGLMPLNLIHINAGITLQNLTQIGASLQNIAMIGLLGFAALIPTFLKGKAEKLEEEVSKEESKKKK